MTKYIALSNDGTDINYGPGNLQSTATEMLAYDGHYWDIQADPADGLFKLYVSRFSRNASGGNGGLVEWPSYAAPTEEGVYLNIVTKGGVKGTTAMAEEDYAAMLKDVAAA